MSHLQELVKSADNFCLTLDIILYNEKLFCESIKKDLESCVIQASQTRDNVKEISHRIDSLKIDDYDLNYYINDDHFCTWMNEKISEKYEERLEELVYPSSTEILIKMAKEDKVWNSLMNEHFNEFLQEYQMQLLCQLTYEEMDQYSREYHKKAGNFSKYYYD